MPPTSQRTGKRRFPAGVSRGRGPARASGTKPVAARPLPVEIVSIGRELLRGRTVDTNAHEIAGFLTQRGASVARMTVVDDADVAIAAALTEALGRGVRLVVTTGGLGPMEDDRTLGAVADALRLPLAVHAHAREMVEGAYRRLHAEGRVPSQGLTAAREKMCALPIGGEPIRNPVGAAPGVLTRLAGGSAVLCLPGVPAEMRSVLEAAMPLLKDLAPKGAVARREVETPTADESSLRTMLERLSREYPAVWIKSETAGFDAEDACVRVVLEASAPDRSQAESMVEEAVRRLISLAAGA